MRFGGASVVVLAAVTRFVNSQGSCEWACPSFAAVVLPRCLSPHGLMKTSYVRPGLTRHILPTSARLSVSLRHF